MEFPDTYFEDEVREGFYIPSLMKRAWAAQMEVLEMVGNICKKYHIRYFAEWGTLLGAVRHKGRIPWDDDIDICMLREDYDKFCEVVEDELPDECLFWDYRKTKGYTNTVGRIINSKVHVQEYELLEKYHGFPYVAGIDIFWLDDLPGTEDVTNLPVWKKNPNYRFSKKCYDKSVLLPFEDTEIVVPVGYDELLFKKYGVNWRSPIRSGGAHDYPSYAKQQKFLEEEQAAQLFEYKFSWAEMDEVRAARVPKETLQNKVKEFIPLFQAAHEEVCQGIEKGDFVSILPMLGECQETAIQIGTWIEQEQGEGHPIVGRWERYCEMLFQIHTQIADGVFADKEDFAKETHEKLSGFMNDLSQHIEGELKERKEIVFVPYKASLWGSMESVWQAAIEDGNTDVYVVPAPYYYKDPFGKAKTEEPHYETEGYPEKVTVTYYEDYNFQGHHPDVIIIQCPYDEYNYGMTLHPFFYAKNLGKYTDRLVYIPPFVMDEIGPESERARGNLKSCCNMPGVVNADMVIVQSEQMKSVYVELLTEFAGENTKTIWEKKIRGLGSPVYDQKAIWTNMTLPEKWLRITEKPEGDRKKIVLYSTSASTVLHYGQERLDEIRDVLRVFQQYRTDISLLWLPDHNAKQILEENAPELWLQYEDLVQEYRDNDWGIYVDLPEIESALQICDACYGDDAGILNRCRNMKKVVMMEASI